MSGLRGDVQVPIFIPQGRASRARLAPVNERTPPAPTPAPVEVTTWYLDMTSPGQLRPARSPDPALGAQLLRARIPLPEYSRFLYTAVGGDWHWTDRLAWTYRDWMAWLDREALATWVLHVQGTPAGYVELEGQVQGDVEVAYFGLLPAFTGRGLGGHLLTEAVRRAWDSGTTWAQAGPPARRVWVHTCSLDGPAALANYEARGFTVYDVRMQVEHVPPQPPGPWPGADRRRPWD